VSFANLYDARMSRMTLGLIGLGTMGVNLARNAARNGATVAVYNRTAEKTDAFMKAHGSEGKFIPTKTIEGFAKMLNPPRSILLMVNAGEAVDAVIDELRSLLSKGDAIIDGGNSHFSDTERREKNLAASGVRFLGMGVSGGAEGALRGPSMMPGGDEDAYKTMEPLLKKMAADDGAGGKCVSYLGPGGSGHFVKMVHNGIEYGVMQLIAEAYHLLNVAGGMKNAELASLFAEWNSDPILASFLLEITAKIFKTKDAETGKGLIDVILDSGSQKGTGKWTTEAALTLGVSIPTITAAVDARIQSAGKAFRIERAKQVKFSPGTAMKLSKEALKDAYLASVVNTYAQGFQLLSGASTEYKWNLNIPEICRIWRGGCIIRSGLLPLYQQAFSGDKDASLKLRATCEGEAQSNWRNVVMTAVSTGIPVPAMGASLSYFDAYRSPWLPQNLTQAQRDFFGAHGFARIDREGVFHGNWKN
jgi:6-phosphogluconate dehydrogenase